MSETTTARPGQVTVAGWIVVIASVVVVVSVFDQLGAIGSVETREGVERFLAEPPGEGLGLGTDTVIGLLRFSAYLAAACAAASAILGWYVLRRDRTARLALTVLALPLFLTGLASGGFFPAIVAGSTLMLWAQPARQWFRDGTSPLAPATTSAGSSSGEARTAVAPPPVAPPAGDSTPLPGPQGSQSSQGSQGAPQPGAQDGPAAWSGWGKPQQSPTPWLAPGMPATTAGEQLTRRPEPVLWSCLVTWIFSGITLLGLLTSVVLVAADGTQLVADARADTPDLVAVDITDEALFAGVLAVLGGLVLWSLAAVVLAALVWRGSEWARITLVVSAALAGLLSVVSIFATLVVIPLAIGCFVSVRMLLARRAAEWCRRPREVR